MINLRNRREKKRWQRKLTKISIIFERQLIKKIMPILGRQYMDAARLLEWEIENVECAVNEQSNREKKLFFNFFKKISSFFEQMVYNLLSELYAQNLNSKKQFRKSFSEKTIQWFSAYSVFIVYKINRTTARRIKQYIDKRKKDGIPLRIIAKELRKVNKRNRAESIARTMIHSIMNYSIDSAIEITNFDYVAEWISSDKEQTKRRIFDHKKASGERIYKGEQFIRTGEELKFPGSPEGSIANIAYCRCILCYYIAKKGLSKYRRIGK